MFSDMNSSTVFVVLKYSMITIRHFHASQIAGYLSIIVGGRLSLNASRKKNYKKIEIYNKTISSAPAGVMSLLAPALFVSHV